MKKDHCKPILCEKENCTGCTACAGGCPIKAIEMKPDGRGFLHPVVNDEKCIGCHNCEGLCPVLHPVIPHNNRQDYYGFKHHDMNIRLKSSSGGFFTWLSDIVLDQGGVIYGAVFDDKFRVIHERAETSQERDSMRGSKYVQSDMGDTYGRLRKDLEDGRWVLFTGTSCQCAGILSAVAKKAYKGRLLTMDFICEGVASPQVFESFKEYEEMKQKGRITRISFRDKEEYPYKKKPILSRRLIIENTDNNGNSDLVYDKWGTSRYLDSLFSGLLQRECCLQCKYHSYDRITDFTCGDFHRYHGPEDFKDEYGISEVLVNTDDARQLIKKYIIEDDFLKCSKEDVWQPLLERGIHVDTKREMFWEKYEREGFAKATDIIMPMVYKREIRKLVLGKIFQIKKNIFG